ncbi:ABC transporter permease [Microbacterium murale]|uniref:Sugar ABC transporter permease n=1 Tax=Microbacterium murale TaxID=1081040 RepID=A0ABQ1RIA0_9MICO|nr:ABC transporter permease [Microbacterium murale]GGD69123.1 sugar ABC transporter permease [Microbacterium murale]
MQILLRLRGANNEGILALVLLVIVIMMSILSPAFFSANTAFSILRSATVPMIFALAVLIVIITGGIDVSFAAVAIFSSYTAVSFFLGSGTDPGVLAIFATAVGIGAVLGLINGVVIARFRLPTLIVTLGTQGLFIGAMFTYVGSRYYADLPPSMAALAGVNVIDFATDRGRAYLHVMVLLALVLTLIVWWMLRYSMFGRSLYAIGGDYEAARRAGFRVVPTQITVYVIVGVLGALAGVAHMIMSRSANPQDLVGDELDIIAAVVLGGASIFGGRGSVIGAALGVLLVQVINNSLLLAGVPSAWLRAAVGILLILGVGIQAVTARRRAKRVHTVDDPNLASTNGGAA